MSDEHDALLLRYLHLEGADCPTCGYDMSVATSPVCPECGEYLRLAVTSYPSRLTGHAFGYVGLTMAVASALVAVFGYAWPEHRVSVFVLLFSATWLGWWLRRWHLFRSVYAALPRHKKQERVALCWLPALVMLLVLASLVS